MEYFINVLYLGISIIAFAGVIQKAKIHVKEDQKYVLPAKIILATVGAYFFTSWLIWVIHQ